MNIRRHIDAAGKNRQNQHALPQAQAVGLSDEEKAEQAALRKEYIEAIRMSLRGNLNSISVKEEDGTITDLGKKYGNVKQE